MDTKDTKFASTAKPSADAHRTVGCASGAEGRGTFVSFVTFLFKFFYFPQTCAIGSSPGSGLRSAPYTRW